MLWTALIEATLLHLRVNRVGSDKHRQLGLISLNCLYPNENPGLCQDFSHHTTTDVGQSIISSLKSEGQLFMVEP